MLLGIRDLFLLLSNDSIEAGWNDFLHGDFIEVEGNNYSVNIFNIILLSS